MTWTPERETLLRELWCAGRSASQIAQILGGTTRNAVIGKAHRLGLSGRVTPTVRPERVSMPRSSSGGGSSSSQPREPRARVVELVEERSEYAVNLLGLTEQTCKWPVGDPRSPDFHFCGRQKEDGLSYCMHHASIAYQVPAKRESFDTKKTG